MFDDVEETDGFGMKETVISSVISQKVPVPAAHVFKKVPTISVQVESEKEPTPKPKLVFEMKPNDFIGKIGSKSFGTGGKLRTELESFLAKLKDYEENECSTKVEQAKKLRGLKFYSMELEAEIKHARKNNFMEES